ncbi:MAG: hypothetical protein PWP07_1100 [Epulopiscium sp.]|nr:hypothetical protein [Candidatus Epulonipiscium sp.]
MAGSNFGDEYKGYDSKILIFHSLQHILHKISGGLLHLFLSNYLISQFYSSPIKTLGNTSGMAAGTKFQFYSSPIKTTKKCSRPGIK